MANDQLDALSQTMEAIGMTSGSLLAPRGIPIAAQRYSPEAIDLARRTPWTVEHAERVINARSLLAPGMDLAGWADAVMIYGLGPLRKALAPSVRETGARLGVDVGLGYEDHGDHCHLLAINGRLGPALPKDSGAIARALGKVEG